jgi:transposase
LRAIRALVNAALERLSPGFAALYADEGRPSIAPERLLRALLLQALFTIRSERQLMQQITYNMLFRWFVGLAMDAPVWDVTVFTKNRDRRHGRRSKVSVPKMAVAIPRCRAATQSTTSTVRSAATRRTPRRRIPMPGSTRSHPAQPPGCATWGTW